MIKIPLIFESVKSYYKNNRWQGRVILTVLIITLILGVVRLLLPQTIIYSTTAWLKNQGIDSSIEAININIIDGTVSLVNAKGHIDGKPLFNIGLIDIYWRWAPLSEKTVVVTKVGLDKFTVNIEQYTDEIIIGGVHIPLNKTSAIESKEPSATDEQTKPWAASLGQVIFTNLDICYLQHSTSLQLANTNSLFIDYCVSLEKMSWAGTISYATDKQLLQTDDLPLSSTGDFSLNGLSITDNKLNKKLLASKSNTLDGVVISGLNSLNINQLEMNYLSLFQREDQKHKDSLRFSQLTIDDIKLSGLNSLLINDISISNPGVYLVKQNQADWEYQQWIPHSSATSKTIDEQKPKKQTTNESSFKLTLNNISINNSDLCYLDSDPSLYYCLTFANLDWKGLVKYDTKTSTADDINILVKGDLKLLRQNLHNQTIDRDLLDFESLTLSKLEVSSINNISLENLNIEKFATLQRSNNKNDNTASFEELAINDIKYTDNKIDINTIKLTGLANTVSKNKNGDWEHDKWQTENKTDNKKATSKTIKTDTEKTTKEKPQTTKKETFIVSLNKLNITSDKKILFIDNSTETVMKMGLKKLAFDISNIHTDKPNSNSPFKLSAKTTRQATINIAGTAKPFADKVSFDANGKIKGFDLRAASPSAKKAIGHIIKSGQMDADLKLLAVDGILDSKLGLSLYHFNIKATSKEDAAKLDAEFGMPLNQTLVLLRDKDDSIHLDIPVTGDVNNPDFNPMQAIVKATSKAATVTLITFFTPYGLIYAGGNMAFNLATALNFDPINFPPGSPKLLAEGKEQLNGLTTLLTEKPNVHLTLCGVTNQQDVFALYPKLKAKGDSAETKLTKEQSLKLKKLATDRQVNSKNYLVKEKSIGHDRLILCEPEHKADGDIAGVEITI